MTIEINKLEFEIGKKLLGKKAFLLGGGGVANIVEVVEVTGYNEDTGQIICKTKTGLRQPYIWSYYLRPLGDGLEDLELGDYILGLSGELRKYDCGLFGTIYDCTLVKKYNEEKEVWENV